MFAEFVSPAALAAQMEPLAELSLAALRAGHRSPLYAELATELRGELEARNVVTDTDSGGLFGDTAVMVAPPKRDWRNRSGIASGE